MFLRLESLAPTLSVSSRQRGCLGRWLRRQPLGGHSRLPPHPRRPRPSSASCSRLTPRRLTAPQTLSLTVFSFSVFTAFVSIILTPNYGYGAPTWTHFGDLATGTPQGHTVLLPSHTPSSYYPFQPQATPPPLSQLASACTSAPCRSSRCSTALRSCDALLNLPSISLGGLTTPRRCRGSRAGPCRAAWPRPGRAPAPRPRGSAARPSRCPRWRRAPAVGPARRGRPW